MSRARWIVLGLYTAGVFLSIPYTRRIVEWSDARLGAGAGVAAVAAVLALAAVLLGRRLALARAAFPWPHLALAAIVAATAVLWRLLAFSPIGRVHIPEYGLLAVLAGRAFGGSTGAAVGGGAAAAGVGLLDEMVQHYTPGRVFDWLDVAANAAAAAIGALACAWWRWVGRIRP